MDYIAEIALIRKAILETQQTYWNQLDSGRLDSVKRSAYHAILKDLRAKHQRLIQQKMEQDQMAFGFPS